MAGGVFSNNMDELKSIRIFLTVVKERSFSEAARQIGTTPASVTRAVAGLEDVLGARLLVRTTRQVSLTAEGAAYAARVSPLVQGITNAAEELRSTHDAYSGLIRVDTPMSFGSRVMPALLSGFSETYRDISIAVTSSDPFNDIVDGDFDLAIRISGPMSDTSTFWRKVCRVPMVLVSAPEGPGTNAVRPEDLRPEHRLAYSAGANDDQWCLLREGSRRTLRADGVVRSNNGDLLASMAEGGAGVALLPVFIVMDGLSRGSLVRVLPEWHPPELWLSLLYPPYDRLPPRVATFSHFFETYLTETHPMPDVDAVPVRVQ
ncbi:MAG: LysR family transcriptional regulator [Pseudomonadota bacterium]